MAEFNGVPVSTEKDPGLHSYFRQGPRYYFVNLEAIADTWGVPLEGLEAEAERRGIKGFSVRQMPKEENHG